MLVALLPLLIAVAGGTPIAAAVGAITAAQWVTIGVAALNALPAEVEAAQAIHSILANVIGEVLEKKSAEVAPSAVQNWLAANGQAAIQRDFGIENE